MLIRKTHKNIGKNDHIFCQISHKIEILSNVYLTSKIKETHQPINL